MKTILIPTDFSKNGADAFEYALHLVDDQETELHIVSIIPPLPQTGEVGVVLTDYDHKQQERVQKDLDTLEMFANNFLKDKSNIKVTTRAMLGPAATLIKQEAQRVEADLIVMGSRGENHSLLDKFAGTVSLGVILDAPCPVLLVPNGFKHQKIKKVLFASALDHADPFELWRAKGLLLCDDANFTCLHIVKEITPSVKKMVSQFEQFFKSQKNNVKANFIVEEHPSVEEGLVEFAKEKGEQIIILTKSRRSLWKKIFGTSHSKKLASMINLPLLIMNEQAM
jgi:nucleotide-binding universal stress UspA family protein